MRYAGNVGFSMTVETNPGIWTDRIIEKPYFGDVVKNTRRWLSAENINDDLRINNQISIVADSFCHAHLFCMKYVTWMGTKFKVESVDINYPRVIITLGGEWRENGTLREEAPEIPDNAGGASGVS